MPKKPDMGSDTVVKGRASIRAPEEMIRRCIGHYMSIRHNWSRTSLSISTPAPYLVPNTNGFFSVIAFNIFGAASGGCYNQSLLPSLYLQIGIHTNHSVPFSFLKPTNNSTTQSPFIRSHNNTNIVSLIMKRINLFNTPIL